MAAAPGMDGPAVETAVGLAAEIPTIGGSAPTGGREEG